MTEPSIFQSLSRLSLFDVNSNSTQTGMDASFEFANSQSVTSRHHQKEKALTLKVQRSQKKHSSQQEYMRSQIIGPLPNVSKFVLASNTGFCQHIFATKCRLE